MKSYVTTKKDTLIKYFLDKKNCSNSDFDFEDEEILDILLNNKFVMNENKKLLELIEWLEGEKYLIDENSTTMTEEFEKDYKWELSRNRMINKTISKIEEMF